MLYRTRCSLPKKCKHSLAPGLVFSLYLYVNTVFFQLKSSHQHFISAIMALQSFAQKRTMLLFSRSVVPNSLWPHGLQHVRLPCPSLLPRIRSNSCPLSWWILQARILEWVVIPFSRVSWLRDWAWVSCIAGGFFTVWATILACKWASRAVLVVKNPPANAGDKRLLDPWVRKIPWSGAQQPTPIFLPGKSHGEWSVVGSSSWGRKESDKTEAT